MVDFSRAVACPNKLLPRDASGGQNPVDLFAKGSLEVRADCVRCRVTKRDVEATVASGDGPRFLIDSAPLSIG